MAVLYEMVKEVQAGYGTEESLLHMFEPKIKTSLRMTKKDNREDLEQELKIKVIHYVRDYSLEDLPGLFELNQKKAL